MKPSGPHSAASTAKLPPAEKNWKLSRQIWAPERRRRCGRDPVNPFGRRYCMIAFFKAPSIASRGVIALPFHTVDRKVVVTIARKS